MPRKRASAVLILVAVVLVSSAGYFLATGGAILPFTGRTSQVPYNTTMAEQVPDKMKVCQSNINCSLTVCGPLRRNSSDYCLQLGGGKVEYENYTAICEDGMCVVAGPGN